MPRSLTTGKAYRGINPFLLAMSASEKGFTSPFWATYKAIAERGGQVRKGEKSEQIVFFKPLRKIVPDPVTGEPRKLSFGMARMFSVFNAEQCDG